MALPTAPPHPQSDLFPVHLGRYTLLDTLGSGGMGSVFLAMQNGAENFRRYVAIKTLLPRNRRNEEVAALFVKEAKGLATASHPNLVQTYDLFRHDDTMYVALEFVHGRDLREVASHLAAKQATMEPQVVCCLLREVAKGLDYIHTLRDDLDNSPRQLVHRDINPKNILLGFDGSVKIADFGLLRSSKGEPSETTLRGTLAYVAPEQLSDESVDQRADIFSLGCVLFELLAQRSLFGETEAEQIAARKQQQVPDVAPLLPEEHAPFLPLLKRMVAAEPADRYSSVADLQIDLEALTHTLTPTSMSKNGWMRAQYPDEERAWGVRKERYAKAMEASELERLRSSLPTAQASAVPRSQLPPAYRSASAPTVNILTRSLLYVAVVAMVSLTVATLLYMVATQPPHDGKRGDRVSESRD